MGGVIMTSPEQTIAVREETAREDRARRWADPDAYEVEATRVARILTRAASLTKISTVASWLTNDEQGGWAKRVRDALVWVKTSPKAQGLSDEIVDEETARYMLRLALDAEIRRHDRDTMYATHTTY